MKIKYWHWPGFFFRIHLITADSYIRESEIRKNSGRIEPWKSKKKKNTVSHRPIECTINHFGWQYWTRHSIFLRRLIIFSLSSKFEGLNNPSSQTHVMSDLPFFLYGTHVIRVLDDNLEDCEPIKTRKVKKKKKSWERLISHRTCWRQFYDSCD